MTNQSTDHLIRYLDRQGKTVHFFPVVHKHNSGNPVAMDVDLFNVKLVMYRKEFVCQLRSGIYPDFAGL